MGCGSGAVAALVSKRGFEVAGCDVNGGALQAARRAVPTSFFFTADVSASDCFDCFAGELVPFDAVVCQLLLSIVGSPAERRQTLHNARSLLAPAGRLFVSFSGRSDDINED